MSIKKIKNILKALLLICLVCFTVYSYLLQKQALENANGTDKFVDKLTNPIRNKLLIVNASTKNDKIKENIVDKMEPFVHPNFKWIYNNRIMQYSVYVIENGTDTWIEGMVNILQPSSKHIRIEINELLGLVKISGTKKIFEVIPFQMYNTGSKQVKRIFMPFDKMIMQKDKISVAIIMKVDFSKEAVRLELKKTKKIFPHDIINFQKPDEVKISEPRVPGVGHCVKYVHKYTDSLQTFLDLSKYFSLSEIILYDPLPTRNVEKLIEANMEKYDFVTIRIYDINNETICLNSAKDLSGYNSVLRKTYIDSCISYVKKELYFKYISKHHDFTLNDCYVKLGYTYEFVAVYDTDEIVFPRTTQANELYESGIISKMKTNYGCDRKELCNYKPFEMSLYNYVKQVIRNNYNGQMDKLNGINFRHTAYLIPENVEINTMNAIRNVSNFIASKTHPFDKFPVYLNVNGPTYTIYKNDVEYVKYLVKIYDSIPCLNMYLQNISNVSGNYRRYIYHTQEVSQRMGKIIHYTKNVQVLWCHYAHKKTQGTRTINGNYINGEFLAHFRQSLGGMYKDNKVTSIRNINIDMEYLSYMLKDDSSYSCLNEIA